MLLHTLYTIMLPLIELQKVQLIKQLTLRTWELSQKTKMVVGGCTDLWGKLFAPKSAMNDASAVHRRAGLLSTHSSCWAMLHTCIYILGNILT